MTQRSKETNYYAQITFQVIKNILITLMTIKTVLKEKWPKF